MILKKIEEVLVHPNGLSSNIQNIKIYSESPEAGINVLTMFSELKEQLLSLGDIRPLTIKERPIFVEPAIKKKEPTPSEGKWTPHIPATLFED